MNKAWVDPGFKWSPDSGFLYFGCDASEISWAFTAMMMRSSKGCVHGYLASVAKSSLLYLYCGMT